MRKDKLPNVTMKEACICDGFQDKQNQWGGGVRMCVWREKRERARDLRNLRIMEVAKVSRMGHQAGDQGKLML